MLDSTFWTTLLVIMNVIWIALLTAAAVFTYTAVKSIEEYRQKIRFVDRLTEKLQDKLRKDELRQMPPPDPVDVANNAINNWFDTKTE